LDFQSLVIALVVLTAELGQAEARNSHGTLKQIRPSTEFTNRNFAEVVEVLDDVGYIPGQHRPCHEMGVGRLVSIL